MYRYPPQKGAPALRVNAYVDCPTLHGGFCARILDLKRVSMIAMFHEANEVAVLLSGDNAVLVSNGDGDVGVSVLVFIVGVEVDLCVSEACGHL
jgi:hypothetical protein